MNEQAHVGVQLFGLGPELEEDFEGKLERLREMGFDAIEPFVLPLRSMDRLPAQMWSLETLAHAVSLAASHGLSVPSAHIAASVGSLRLPARRLAATIREAAELSGVRRFVLSGMFANDRDARSWARYLSSVSALLAGSRAEVVYHNHDMELTPIVRDGRLRYPLDTFFENADDSVRMQLDIGWAAFAGDELALLSRYADRIVSLHCKDFAPGTCRSGITRDEVPAERFAPIGHGEVRTAEAVAAYLALPQASGSIIIDQDKCAGDRFEELGLGIEAIRTAVSQAEADDATSPVAELRQTCGDAGADRSRLSLMTFSLEPELMLGKMTVEDTLGLAARAGVPRVDLMNIHARDIPSYLTAMSRTGVTTSCYITSLPFLDAGEKLSRELQRQLSIACALKAERFMIVPYVLPTELSRARKMGKDAVRDLMVSGFSLAVGEGRNRGIDVCFETTPHDELALSSSADCLRVLDAVEGLGLVFDTANMLPAGEDPWHYYEQVRGRVCHVHLKDVILTNGSTLPFDEVAADGRKMSCCLWGEGEVPVRELCHRMVEDGYEGAFAIEYARPSGLCGAERHQEQLEAQLSGI